MMNLPSCNFSTLQENIIRPERSEYQEYLRPRNIPHEHYWYPALLFVFSIDFSIWILIQDVKFIISESIDLLNDEISGQFCFRRLNHLKRLFIFFSLSCLRNNCSEAFFRRCSLSLAPSSVSVGLFFWQQSSSAHFKRLFRLLLEIFKVLFTNCRSFHLIRANLWFRRYYCQQLDHIGINYLLNRCILRSLFLRTKQVCYFCQYFRFRNHHWYFSPFYYYY